MERSISCARVFSTSRYVRSVCLHEDVFVEGLRPARVVPRPLQALLQP